MNSKSSIYTKIEEYYKNRPAQPTVEEFLTFFKPSGILASEELKGKQKDNFVKKILDFLCKEKNLRALSEVKNDICTGMEALVKTCQISPSFPLSENYKKALVWKRNITIVLHILCELEYHLEQLQELYMISHLPKLLSLFRNNKLTKDIAISYLSKMPSDVELMQLLGNAPITFCGLQIRMDAQMPYPKNYIPSSFTNMINERFKRKEIIQNIIQNNQEQVVLLMHFLTSNELEAVESKVNLFLKAIKELMGRTVEGPKKTCIPGQKSLF